MNMYRMNQYRSMASRQRYDIEANERMLSRRSMNCQTCNLGNEKRHTAEKQNDNCGCMDNSNSTFDYSLAMVYSPKQEWQNLYCEDEGFAAGTIFKELDKPFYGSKCGGACNE